MSENSGFENLMTASALDKDEAEFMANYGSIQNVNVSFSGIYPPSQYGLNFMPSEDSLFQHCRDLESINISKDEITNKQNSFQANYSHRPALDTSTSHHHQTHQSKPQRTTLSGLPKISEISEIISTLKEKNNNLETVLRFDKLLVPSYSTQDDGDDDSNAESFQIESTRKSFTWPAIQVGETKKMSCFLKHRSVKSENLYFIFGDGSMNCFRFVRNGDLLSEFSARIKPNFPFELEIIFLPDCVSQLFGTVEIKRMPKKRVICSTIHLYGYGGKSIPSLNIGYDLISHSPQLVINQSKLTNFSIRNLGTDDLFFILNIRAKFTHEFTFEILPESGLVPPGGEKIVTIKLNRYKKYKNIAYLRKLRLMKIAELEMYFGDESTRLRIVRIYNKSRTLGNDKFLSFVPELITDVLTRNSLQTTVSELNDDIDELPLLYVNGTDKCNINLFFERCEFTNDDKSKLDFTPLEEK